VLVFWETRAEGGRYDLYDLKMVDVRIEVVGS